MTEIVRVSRIFVPGKMPDYTYNPRSDLQLETQLADYIEEGGAILTLSGPTKTGKTVLIDRVVKNAAKIEGQGVESVDALWARVVDALGAFTEVEIEGRSGETGGASGETQLNIGIVSSKGTADFQSIAERASRVGVTRPIASVAREALLRRGAALVIDDFHFIDRPVQTQIVRALKPLVLAGVPIILVSISHRVQDVVTAEPDMTGRVTSIAVNFWSIEELMVIAGKGFSVLGVDDPEERMARRLAETSYGSPHLMQRFCRELCKANEVRETVVEHKELQPPANWDTFFAAQTDGASSDWFRKLLRGAQERGGGRTKWPTKDFGDLDYYGVTLAGIAATGPRLTLTKDEIKSAAESVVIGGGPAANQVTRALIHMSKIAATRMGAVPPSDEELDADAEEHLHDVQPVLEYIEDGPSSMLHISDPFFAHFVRYGSAELLRAAGGGEDGVHSGETAD